MPGILEFTKGLSDSKKVVSGHRRHISGDLPAIFGTNLITGDGGARRMGLGTWGAHFSWEVSMVKIRPAFIKRPDFQLPENGSRATKKMVSGHQRQISEDLPAIFGANLITGYAGASQRALGTWGAHFSYGTQRFIWPWGPGGSLYNPRSTPQGPL